MRIRKSTALSKHGKVAAIGQPIARQLRLHRPAERAPKPNPPSQPRPRTRRAYHLADAKGRRITNDRHHGARGGCTVHMNTPAVPGH